MKCHADATKNGRHALHARHTHTLLIQQKISVGHANSPYCVALLSAAWHLFLWVNMHFESKRVIQYDESIWKCCGVYDVAGRCLWDIKNNDVEERTVTWWYVLVFVVQGQAAEFFYVFFVTSFCLFVCSRANMSMHVSMVSHMLIVTYKLSRAWISASLHSHLLSSSWYRWHLKFAAHIYRAQLPVVFLGSCRHNVVPCIICLRYVCLLVCKKHESCTQPMISPWMFLQGISFKIGKWHEPRWCVRRQHSRL